MIQDQIPNSIMFAGDWHANIQQAQNVLINAANRDIHHVIQVGDFGIWKDSEKFLYRLQKTCERYDIQLYFVDGNHEHFPLLYGYPLAEDGTRTVRPNIHHLPRGLRWEWDGIKFLALGGAYSVDRAQRTLGISWFKEEEVSDEDILKAINYPNPQTDVLVMHDSPGGAPNPVVDDPRRAIQGVHWFGKESIDAANKHREKLQIVPLLTDPVLIVHGHYHNPAQATYRRSTNGTRTDVISLDQGSTSQKLHEHTLTVTMSDLHILRKDNRDE